MGAEPDNNSILNSNSLDLVADLVNPQETRLGILALSAHYLKSLSKKTCQPYMSDRPYTPCVVIF